MDLFASSASTSDPPSRARPRIVPHPDPAPATGEPVATSAVDAAARLAETEARLRSLVEALPAAVYLDRYRRDDGTFVAVDYVSPQMEQITGYPAGDFLLDPDLWIRLVHPEDRERVLAVNVRRHLSGAALAHEYRIVRRDGNVVWVREEASVVASAEADTILLHGLITDVADRKHLEQQLNHLAFHDALTGLANRSLFEDRVAHRLEDRRNPRRAAVLFLDLDDFKSINDSLGHATGDRFLEVIASRLSGAIRPGDTVARMGGDEFAILLADVDDTDGAETAADRVLEVLREPIELDGRRLTGRASCGIAIAGEDGTTAADLLRNADAAMYRAKRQRRGGWSRYDPSIHADALARLDVESELRRAVANEELYLVYQPIVAFSTGSIEGAEVLARWTHPTLGAVPPSVFIPIAEETDLMVEIGRWVLDQACRQVANWRAAGAVEHDFTISVNVSAGQLTKRLPGDIASILHDSGLPARNLTVEVTESAVLGDASSAIEVLSAIRALGVSVALDDFGTGYSSLSHLRTLPIDIVKIDRSFVADVERPVEAALVRAVVHLAEARWLRTVAEGVETQAQADALAALGCDFGQGYLFAKPVAPEWFVRNRSGRGALVRQDDLVDAASA